MRKQAAWQAPPFASRQHSHSCHTHLWLQPREALNSCLSLPNSWDYWFVLLGATFPGESDRVPLSNSGYHKALREFRTFLLFGVLISTSYFTLLCLCNVAVAFWYTLPLCLWLSGPAPFTLWSVHLSPFLTFTGPLRCLCSPVSQPFFSLLCLAPTQGSL